MMLYLARHGDASHPGSNEPSSLTERGKTDITQMALALSKKNLKIDRLWHSPKIRTFETAEIYGDILAIPKTQRLEKEAIGPDGDALQVYQEVVNLKNESLLVVSHLPFLEELTTLLLEGLDPPPEVLYPTAGIAAFEYDSAWKSLWLMNPSSLKK